MGKDRMIFLVVMIIYSVVMAGTCIFMGILFKYHPPKNINDTYGYRTRMSSINQYTWDFAHQCAGKIYFIVGIISMPIMIVLSIVFCNKSWYEVYAVVLMFVEVLPMIVPIFFVEHALKKHFDRNGRLR